MIVVINYPFVAKFSRRYRLVAILIFIVLVDIKYTPVQEVDLVLLYKMNVHQTFVSKLGFNVQFLI